MKKVAMLHTSAATLTMMQQLITDIMPDVEVMHLVEESMIKQVMKAQGVTPNIAAASPWVSARRAWRLAFSPMFRMVPGPPQSGLAGLGRTEISGPSPKQSRMPLASTP